jgi:WD40 repeat protein/serine/threonine protein kinase
MSISASSDERQQRFEEVVAAYLEAVEAGRAESLEVLLQRHPDLAEEITAFFAHQEEVARLAGPLRELAVVPTSPQTFAPMTGILGDFRIVREIGRGGMGIVYEAEQLSLRRRVALKVLPLAGMLDPRHLQRFRNEAQAAACLQHPHIVPVYAVGSERGVHYYAMQLIDGRTLAQFLEQQHQGGQAPRPDETTSDHIYSYDEVRTGDEQSPGSDEPTLGYLPGAAAAPSADTIPQARPATVPAARDAAYFRRVVEWGIQAAEALEHAHALGIVHRDVKPGNLMLDGQGKLWVTDFGLARTGFDAGLTVSGDLLGTLRYMSPEQALARHGLVDHRTDVYSLGATLFELLTLRPAVDGEDRQELLRQITFEEPQRPRLLNWALPQELEIIVLKAMEKTAADRYATAQELADDLCRWLRDEPIRARRPTLAQRGIKWARRHRSIVWSAGIMLLIAFVGSILSSMLVTGAYRAETDAREKAEREAETVQGLLYRARMNTAYQAWSVGRIKLSQELLDAYLPQKGKPDRRAWEWHYIRGLHWRDLFRLGVPDTPLRDHHFTSCAWSPDGRRIAAVTRKNNNWGGPGIACVWDAASGRELTTFQGHQGSIFGLVWSPDSRRLATGCLHGEVHIWDADTGKQVLAMPRQETAGIGRLSWSPDGKYLAAWAGDIVVWNAVTGKEAFRVASEQLLGFPELVWSPDGTRLAITVDSNHGKEGKDCPIMIWHVPQKKHLTALRGHQIVADGPFRMGVYACAWSPDGRHLASAGWDRTVRVWDVTEGKEVHSLGIGIGPGGIPFPGPILAWSPDGKRLAATDDGPVVYLWADLVDRGREPRRFWLRGHTDKIPSLGWSPDGRYLASGSTDGTVRVWDTNGQELFALRGHEGASMVAWNPNGYRLLTGNQREIKVWDAVAPEVIRLPRHRDAVLSVSWSPNDRQLALASENGALRIWDQPTARYLRTLPGLGQRANYCPWIWSPTGRRLAGPTLDNGVQVWDLDDANRSVKLQGHKGRVYAITWSPDGRRLATIGQDKEVRVWDVAGTGRVVHTLAPHFGGMAGQRLSWSPDGRWLASVSVGVVRIWNPESGTLLTQLQGSKEGRFAEALVTWSPDGRRLAYNGPGESIKVWDVELKVEVQSFRHARASCAAWSRDGDRLATAGDADGTIVFWDVATGQEALTLRPHTAKVNCLAWSKDGLRLATACQDGTACVLDAAAPEARWPSLAVSNARLAWQLATAQEVCRRNASRATELARQALQQAMGMEGSELSWHRMVLGVALYRSSDWKGAAELLEQTCAAGDDPSGLFFLAMARWQLGEKQQAREWYDRAVKLTAKNRPQDEELRLFRTETATLLGIREPPAKGKEESPQKRPVR